MKKEFNHIDDLLKGTLEGFSREPSPAVWKRISRELAAAGRGLYIALGIFIALSGLLFYSLQTTMPKQKNVEQASSNSQMQLSESMDEPVTTSSVKPSENKKITKNNHPKLTSIASADKAETDEGSNEAILKTNLPPEEVSKSKYTELVTESPNYFSKFPGLERLGNFEDFYRKPLVLNSSDYLNSPFFISERAQYQSVELKLQDDYGRRLNLDYGMYVVPELIFMPEDSNNGKSAMNFDLTARYLKNDWFVEAGIGFGFANDNGIFDVNYSQYDSIGYFFKVSDVNFDPVTGKPVLETVTEDVYDTVNYHQVLKTDNRYTYLRIPVYAGLCLREIKRFSLYLKGGLIYSVLLNGREPAAIYTNDRATEIFIQNNTPGRIHSNLQLSGGIALQYQLSRNIALSVEPVGNYYIKPVYSDRLESKSPWSLGSRFGIILNFN